MQNFHCTFTLHSKEQGVTCGYKGVNYIDAESMEQKYKILIFLNEEGVCRLKLTYTTVAAYFRYGSHANSISGVATYTSITNNYSRTPELETADLSQSHTGLNLF